MASSGWDTLRTDGVPSRNGPGAYPTVAPGVRDGERLGGVGEVAVRRPKACSIPYGWLRTAASPENAGPGPSLLEGASMARMLDQWIDDYLTWMAARGYAVTTVDGRRRQLGIFPGLGGEQGAH